MGIAWSNNAQVASIKLSPSPIKVYDTSNNCLTTPCVSNVVTPPGECCGKILPEVATPVVPAVPVAPVAPVAPVVVAPVVAVVAAAVIAAAVVAPVVVAPVVVAPAVVEVPVVPEVPVALPEVAAVVEAAPAVPLSQEKQVTVSLTDVAHTKVVASKAKKSVHKKEL